MPRNSSDSEGEYASYEDIRPFFSKRDWNDLSQYEKKSYQSSKRNYEAMLRAGLNPRKPFFMMSRAEKEGRSEKKQVADPPQPERRGRPRKRVVEPRAREPLQRTRASRRIHSMYHFDEEAKDDEDDDEGCILFCDSCNQAWMGDCPAHGPPPTIEDTEVAAGEPERSMLSAPATLTVAVEDDPMDPVAESDDDDGTVFGAHSSHVFTSEAIEKRTRFGPYQGDIPRLAESTAKPSPDSNWMRHVKVGPPEEANLRPFEYRGRMYFCAMKEIPACSELVVSYVVPKEFPLSEILGVTDPRCACCVCGRDFASPLLRAQHERASARCQSKIVQSRRDRVERARSQRAYRSPSPPSDGSGSSTASFERRRGTLKEQLRQEWRKMQAEQCDLIMYTQGKIDAQSYHCDTCRTDFKRACSLRAHMETVHTFGGGSPSPSKGRKALQSMENCPSYACSSCSATFTRMLDLRDHVLMTHYALGKRFPCEVCGQAFSRESALENHALTAHKN